MDITICDLNPHIIAAFAHQAPELRAIRADICTVDAEGYVSPSNSFGWMDGGVDAAYMRRFPGIEAKVMDAIAKRRMGELLVGEAIVTPTGCARVPWLVSAPTMRVPGPIHDWTDVFLSTRAAVTAAIAAGLSTLALPGMGTLTGRVPPLEAAVFMRAGIRAAMGQPERHPIHSMLYVRPEGAYR